MIKNRRFSDNTSLKQPREKTILFPFGLKGDFFMQKISAKFLAKSGVIAGLYVCLSLIVFPFASGSIQLRVGEALTLLPLLFIEAIPALFVGCIIVNVLTGCLMLDVIVGSMVTLFSAILTFFIGKIIKKSILRAVVGGIFPIILNAFILPITWVILGVCEYAYLVQVLLILAGQLLAVYGIGIPIYIAIKNKLK